MTCPPLPPHCTSAATTTTIYKSSTAKTIQKQEKTRQNAKVTHCLCHIVSVWHFFHCLCIALTSPSQEWQISCVSGCRVLQNAEYLVATNVKQL